ncbi:hypothetical protein [Novosphingobium mangrovi (ex Huang et al. 2023)]|uniref:Uncharacterized protein n=1 Tax=Novosphingobium mangrovi (ex Huang et al. 2023) TaxID=2976432 RepID=A0ABT2I0F6_9SPHN|nr:hypothetical protein [Novosphingobium mangrovi (ex Huang et al. 2023)]MCT2398082.1 hypothetical protein [Novosphingobium mangrovi (ex Huang et al. 2023)]
MYPNAASRKDALRASIDALDEIVSLYDRLGLMVPAVHAATALEAARSALANGMGAAAMPDEPCGRQGIETGSAPVRSAGRG